MKTIASKLRAQKAALLRFAFLGILSYVLLLAGTAACVELGGMPAKVAYGMMLTLVLAWNFYANRKFVFPSSHGDGATAQGLRFAAASSGFRFLEYLLVTLLMLDWLRLPYALAITLGTGGMLGLKYVVFSRLVFRPRATGAESLSCRL